MQLKLHFFLILLFCSFYFLSHGQSYEVAEEKIAILQTVLTDSDFQIYASSGKCEIHPFPITLHFAGKAYMLEDSISNLKVIPLDSINLASAFIVKSIKYKNSHKVKIKLNYLDKKLRFTAKRIGLCLDWNVRTFVAREAGSWKPELFVLK